MGESMRKWIVGVGLVVVAVACGTGADMVGEMLDGGVPDAGAQPTPTPVGKFVGYTSQGYRLSVVNPGEGGLFNTYAACQSDFGATARICTVAEVLGTVDLPAPPPERDPDTPGSGDGAWMAQTLDQTPSCFASSSGSAPYLLPDGRIIGGAGCGEVRVLACCTVN